MEATVKKYLRRAEPLDDTTIRIFGPYIRGYRAIFPESLNICEIEGDLAEMIKILHHNRLLDCVSLNIFAQANLPHIYHLYYFDDNYYHCPQLTKIMDRKMCRLYKNKFTVARAWKYPNFIYLQLKHHRGAKIAIVSFRKVERIKLN